MSRSLLNLRDRLRQDTKVAHEMLDNTVSHYDLATASGLAGFLQMHAHALQYLLACPSDAACTPLMADLLERVRDDLTILDASPCDVSLPAPARLEGLAIDYVVAGSRLGTQVLKTRWEAASDPIVRKASHYFTAPKYIEYWQSFCETTGRILANDPFGQVVLRDAALIFDVYQTCANAAQGKSGPIYGSE